MGCTNSTAKEAKSANFTDIGPASSTASGSSSKAVERLRNKGNAEFAKQKFDTAISLYSDALGIDPTDYRCLCNRSACYAEKAMWTKAYEDAQNCIKTQPDFPKGYMRAGYALKELERYKEALDTFKQGQRYDFSNEELRLLVLEVEPLVEEQKNDARKNMPPAELLKAEGNDCFKAAQFDEAIKKYTQSLGYVEDKRGPLAVACLNNRAACHQQQGNFPLVVEDATAVLKIEPDNVKALIRRALSYESLERYENAMADIRKVLGQNPKNEVANKAQHRIGAALRALQKNGFK